MKGERGRRRREGRGRGGGRERENVHTKLICGKPRYYLYMTTSNDFHYSALQTSDKSNLKLKLLKPQGTYLKVIVAVASVPGVQTERIEDH